MWDSKGILKSDQEKCKCMLTLRAGGSAGGSHRHYQILGSHGGFLGRVKANVVGFDMRNLINLPKHGQGSLTRFLVIMLRYGLAVRGLPLHRGMHSVLWGEIEEQHLLSCMSCIRFVHVFKRGTSKRPNKIWYCIKQVCGNPICILFDFDFSTHRIRVLFFRVNEEDSVTPWSSYLWAPLSPCKTHLPLQTIPQHLLGVQLTPIVELILSSLFPSRTILHRR